MIRFKLHQVCRLSGRKRSDRGITIVEILVAVALLAIMGVSVSRSLIFITSENSRNITRALALKLALDRLEELAAVNPLTLSDSNDASGTVTENGRTFTRTVDVTRLDGGSRRVVVTVVNNAPVIPISVTVQNTFAPWEIQ